MTQDELLQLLDKIQEEKCESETLELKAALKGTPQKLFSTLSSFSNQNKGGTIVFGVDEQHDFDECGVYDPQDLQQKVVNQCKQMEPVVRPVFTHVKKNNKMFVSAEIPGMDYVQRPCYYKGHGISDSYIRNGDSDDKMTDYEIFSILDYRKHVHYDIRPCSNITDASIESEQLARYTELLKKQNPKLVRFSDEELLNQTGMKSDGVYTLAADLLFGIWPQGIYPQFCILAAKYPGNYSEQLSVKRGSEDERFQDSKRIEGNLFDMLNSGLKFIRDNQKNPIRFDDKYNRTQDHIIPDSAIREALLNALLHRDYSPQAESQAIRITMFDDRIEIASPGEIYGNVSLNELGRSAKPETRNPCIVRTMELFSMTENRYSGIPEIRRAMHERKCPDPIFQSSRGMFTVTLCSYSEEKTDQLQYANIYEFLQTPRTRQEIADYYGIRSVAYAIKTHITPLVADGKILLTLPNTPRSKNQKYYTNPNL